MTTELEDPPDDQGQENETKDDTGGNDDALDCGGHAVGGRLIAVVRGIAGARGRGR